MSTTTNDTDTTTELNSLTSRAAIALKLKGYDDLRQCMVAMAHSSTILSKKQHHLLQKSYNQILAPLTTGHHRLLIISRLIDGSRRKMELTRDYIQYVEEQWMEYAMEGIRIVDQLLAKESDAVGKVFYLKMRGEITMGLVQIYGGGGRRRMLRETRWGFMEGVKVAEEYLEVGHPLRIGIGLQLAYFLGEVVGRRGEGVTVGRGVLRVGEEGEEKEKEEKVSGKEEPLRVREKEKKKETGKKTTELLQLVKDNLVYWGGGAK